MSRRSAQRWGSYPHAEQIKFVPRQLTRDASPLIDAAVSRLGTGRRVPVAHKQGADRSGSEDLDENFQYLYAPLLPQQKIPGKNAGNF